MSYTSDAGKWIDTAGLDTLTSNDKPLSAWRCRTLANNINHLRDITTQTRISEVAAVGASVAQTDVAGDKYGIWAHYVIPWTVLGPKTLATPVVRIGGFRDAAGTSYLRAAMFPIGASVSGTPMAELAETSFTAESSTVLVESELAITWPSDTMPRPGKPAPPVPASLVRNLTGLDPLTKDGATFAPSAVSVILVQFVLFARGASPSSDETLDLTLLELREYGGGTP